MDGLIVLRPCRQLFKLLAESRAACSVRVLLVGCAELPNTSCHIAHPPPTHLRAELRTPLRATMIALLTLNWVRPFRCIMPLASHSTGYQLGEHEMWEKYTNWELAARVPFIIADPSKAGDNSIHPVILDTLHPTPQQWPLKTAPC